MYHTLGFFDFHQYVLWYPNLPVLLVFVVTYVVVYTLIHVTCSDTINPNILQYFSDRILMSQMMQKEEQLLQYDVGFFKEATTSNALPCLDTHEQDGYCTCLVCLCQLPFYWQHRLFLCRK